MLVHIWTYMYIYKYTHIHTYSIIYIYIHVYTYTYTHIYMVYMICGGLPMYQISALILPGLATVDHKGMEGLVCPVRRIKLATEPMYSAKHFLTQCYTCPTSTNSGHCYLGL